MLFRVGVLENEDAAKRCLLEWVLWGMRGLQDDAHRGGCFGV